MSLLDAGLNYAGRGWSIIPIIGKRAGGLWKPFQRRPADRNTLRRMFNKPGITGLAVVLGKVSGGVAVRDFDNLSAYHAWADANSKDAANLPTTRTARGFHIYGRLDFEQYRVLGDGELRGDSGHYVLVPPSVHPDGISYTWTIPLPKGDLPILPDSLPARNWGEATGEPRKDNPEKTQANSRSTQEYSLHVSPSQCFDSQIEDAIAGTLPTGSGQRNGQLFAFARILKGFLRHLDRDELRQLVRIWHQRALPFIRTKDFDESWADFAIAWEKVKHPAGRSLQAALDAATNQLPQEALPYGDQLRYLVSICCQLQKQWGESPFPLGCRTAGVALGISKTQANRLLKVLVLDGVLSLVTKGDKKSTKASEWRYIYPEQRGIDQ